MLSEDVLTPTESLILEILVSRRRLGEQIWTFEKRFKNTIQELENKGFAYSMSGSVENTIRAGLTEEAFGQFCSYDYTPPIAYDNSMLKNVFSKTTDEAKAIKNKSITEGDHNEY